MNEIPAPSEKTFEPTRKFRRYMVLKRILDLITASLAIVVAGIPMLLIALLVKLDSKGEAVFRQKRIGRHMKPFYCLKFRSMSKEAPRYCATKDLQSAGTYITRVGSVLRKTSLDELPQLINIIKGEMSFIGPRPLIPEETAVHALREQYGVYNLRPGISGYAQIHGRDMVSDEEKAKLDRTYLERFSLKADIGIFFSTILNVLKSTDIHEGSFEAEETEGPAPEKAAEEEAEAVLAGSEK
jgi:O-antigen biosynthesis protein WbqP